MSHSVEVHQLRSEGRRPPDGSQPFMNVLVEWGVVGVWGVDLIPTYFLRGVNATSNYMLVAFTNVEHAEEWLAEHAATWKLVQRLGVTL